MPFCYSLRKIFEEQIELYSSKTDKNDSSALRDKAVKEGKALITTSTLSVDSDPEFRQEFNRFQFSKESKVLQNYSFS